MRVIVAGALANKPFNGGEAWVRLSWVRGLEELGAEVHFVEQIERGACFDHAGRPAPFEASCNRDWFRCVTREFGLEDRAFLIHDNGADTDGGLSALFEIAESADLLVNISGHLDMPAVLERIPLRAYIDIDPGYTQIWLANGEPGLRMAHHQLHFTIGENIGTPGCPIPSAGLEWIPVRQPVVLSDWPLQPAPPDGAFTTVASWRGAFGPLQHQGRTYGLKVHEFRKLVDLPERAGQPLEIALDIHPADDADRERLLRHGWRLTDPRQVVPDPDSFRRYVAASRAEFSVAQGVYTATGSGWFSDRTTRYLASGRPAVVQDTGFGRTLPLGDGLVPFRSPADAAAAIGAVARDYEHHAAAARDLAEQYFDSGIVLRDFLDNVDFRRRTGTARLPANHATPQVRWPADRTAPRPSDKSGLRPVDMTTSSSSRSGPARRPLTIVVSGMLAGVPGQGGAAWAVLQYILGLRRLGHDVHFMEPVAMPQGDASPALAASPSAAYMDDIARSFDLTGRLSLLRTGTNETWGRTWDQLLDTCERADVLINLSGLLRDPRLVERIPVRAYLDLDPGFTQLWHTVQGVDMGFGGHTHFVTVGLAIGSPDCPVPTCGLEWIPTVQPIVLDQWPVRAAPDRRNLTTIANWRGYGSIECNGVLYGQKAHSLREFFDLPSRTDVPFELALSIHEKETPDIEALVRYGWARVDPAHVASTPGRYRRFVRDSWAEFGIAKSGYVHSRCGWFSDRSLCYLASGRPVLAQQTGYSDYLPGDHGILAFDTTETALTAIADLEADYERHSRAARSIAEQVFDSDTVLPRLLQRIGAQ